jgi:hypothetical protein
VAAAVVAALSLAGVLEAWLSFAAWMTTAPALVARRPFRSATTSSIASVAAIVASISIGDVATTAAATA